MQRIGDDYSVPLLMKYRDGMSYEDISEDLNVPVGALKVRVHRARKQLKTYLEDVL
jgi:RNA polymerase sigma-70 factor, ECF subfamily